MKFRLIEEYLFEDIEAVRKYYPKISDSDFNTIIRLDPTFQENRDSVGKYGKWLLSLYDNGKLEITDNITSILKEFDDNKKFLKDKDIGKFKSIEDVASYINNDDNYNEMSHRQEVRQRQKDRKNANLVQDADLVFENGNWLVYVPKTYAASCKLGRGTQWCTATTENDNYYKRYTSKGKLYININKENPSKKYQFHFETKSYMDEKDDPISIVDFFVDNPDLFNFYKTIINGDIETEEGYEIVPTVSFILDNPSDTFIYQKDNAKLFDTYGVWLSERIKHLIIDNSITKILWMSFENFENLETVEISDSVTSIGSEAFIGCSRLTSVTIPNSVTSIGDDAFRNCSSLTSITIPDGVTRIENNTFYGCSSLTSLTIGNSVISIDDGAFRGCSSLTSVTIPNSVTSIGDYAFQWCSNLTSIDIPDSVTNIGDNAFEYCISLTSVTIGDSVTIIGNFAFRDCYSLKSITIPDSVASIGNYVFYDCGRLNEVFYRGTQEQWNSIDISNGNNSLLDADISFIGE